ncbi:unnamed protein product [Soboliphyme baturini]|uniref:Uncharacterized protein n=1 Tax=Soboliphyme baturini TaxID=241478 RepID=A0A183IRB3_9BILA|nr:unnamed protein product [Soboliphyme baturini]
MSVPPLFLPTHSNNVFSLTYKCGNCCWFDGAVVRAVGLNTVSHPPPPRPPNCHSHTLGVDLANEGRHDDGKCCVLSGIADAPRKTLAIFYGTAASGSTNLPAMPSTAAQLAKAASASFGIQSSVRFTVDRFNASRNYKIAGFMAMLLSVTSQEVFHLTSHFTRCQMLKRVSKVERPPTAGCEYHSRHLQNSSDIRSPQPKAGSTTNSWTQESVMAESLVRVLEYYQCKQGITRSIIEYPSKKAYVVSKTETSIMMCTQHKKPTIGTWPRMIPVNKM